MYACDFEYDGQYLSDYGFIICNFNGSSDFDVVSAGSKITFNTVSRHRGKKYSSLFNLGIPTQLYNNFRLLSITSLGF